VLLLKSLFCFTGSDNRHRFIAIHLSCYFLFAIVSSILSSNGLLSFLVLCLFASTSTLSTKRRLNDIPLKANWLITYTCSFLIAGLIIIMSDHSSSYWLLLFPLAISTLLMTYKSEKNNHIFGYDGDIDLTGYIKQGSYQDQLRIEPTFNQDDVAHSHTSLNKNNSSVYIQSEKTGKNPNVQPEGDIGEVIRLKLLNNKHAVLALTIFLFIAIILMMRTSDTSSFDNTENSISGKSEIAPETQSKQDFQHEVTLPDNFSLSISSFKGITVKWQGDETSEDFIWQQLTAQGDETCMAITYNNGKAIRTLNVIQTNNGDYLANFSPLDTKEIINNIAIRNSFTLCGYKFSLKGSQSILGKHSYYSNFITN